MFSPNPALSYSYSRQFQLPNLKASRSENYIFSSHCPLSRPRTEFLHNFSHVGPFILLSDSLLVATDSSPFGPCCPVIFFSRDHRLRPSSPPRLDDRGPLLPPLPVGLLECSRPLPPPAPLRSRGPGPRSPHSAPTHLSSVISLQYTGHALLVACQVEDRAWAPRGGGKHLNKALGEGWEGDDGGGGKGSGRCVQWVVSAGRPCVLEGAGGQDRTALNAGHGTLDSG